MPHVRPFVLQAAPATSVPVCALANPDDTSLGNDLVRA
ncbi:hypothetical protein LMG27952_00116 [Paraburkholderia hiiakae]|uniref:Uncharacterized protein n=1 Tax=Paraburkholderia hiiakae TaxID=1081782 RepID=A0ABN7HC86_9BURK|nr:hypothetical protein LMG27952_00116 [Paraburkholderia hiiakae]